MLCRMLMSSSSIPIVLLVVMVQMWLVIENVLQVMRMVMVMMVMRMLAVLGEEARNLSHRGGLY